MSSPYTAMKSPGNPVGIGDVVKMEYFIGYGEFDSGVEDGLAWTDSYNLGITLSDIQWGFVNTATQKGDETTGKISFTLHDIAGHLFEKYMHLRTGTKYIYFQGPMSSGQLWPDGVSIYKVDTERCSLEFSQTQGFTYTIAGISAAMVTRTSTISAPNDFTITNVINGSEKDFKSIVEDELVYMWNKKIIDSKKGTAQLKVIMDSSKDINSKYINSLPANNDTKGEGDKGGTFQHSIKTGQTIYDAITSLWYEKFQTTTHKNDNVRCRVDFKKWEGSEVVVEVMFTDKTMEDSLTNPITICVGDDKNCSSWPYRAELASINLGDLANTFSVHQGDADSESDQTAPKSSTTSPPITPSPSHREYPIAHGSSGDNEITFKPSGFFSKGEGDRASSYWGQMFNLIQKNTTSQLEIELNMPYTSDMAPTVCGGILKSGMSEKAPTIDTAQNATFKFYWYTNPNCDELTLSPVISGDYRISEVNHQIGLSGNQTTVKLSHLQLGA